MMFKLYVSKKYQSWRFVWYLLKRLAILQISVGGILGVIGHRFGWIGLLGLIILLLSLRRKLLLFTLCALVAFGYAELIVGHNFRQSVEQFYGQQVLANFVVVTDPQNSDYNQTAVISSELVPAKISARLPLYPKLKVGNKFLAKMSLEAPELIESFDYPTYLSTQGIYYLGQAREVELLEGQVSLSSVMADTRARVKDLLFRNLNYEAASLLAGLVIGTREDLSERFTQSLQVTGTTHIVAVSGYNVSLVITMLLSLAGYIPRKVLLWISLLGIFLFIALVGFDNLPAFRAGLMGAVLIFSLMSGRRHAILFSLVYAVFLMLIINPLVWLSVSFQLSVSAFVGMFFFADVFVKLLAKFPFGFGENVGTTLGVLIATLPITINSFGVTSLIAPVVNAVVLPIVPLATLLGIFMSIFSLTIIEISPLFGPIEVILDLIIGMINIFGKLSFAVTESKPLGWAVNLFLLAGFIFLDYYAFKSTLQNQR